MKYTKIFGRLIFYGGIIVGFVIFILPALTRQYPPDMRSPSSILHDIYNAENNYHSKYGVFTSLHNLSDAKPPILDFVTGSGRRSGYSFILNVNIPKDDWNCIAIPIDNKIINTYYINATGIIRYRSDRIKASIVDSAVK